MEYDNHYFTNVVPEAEVSIKKKRYLDTINEGITNLRASFICLMSLFFADAAANDIK